MATVQYFGEEDVGRDLYPVQDNLRRFKKEQYQLGRHEEIILFFGEFEEYLTEDEMWALSESLKPRGTKVAK